MLEMIIRKTKPKILIPLSFAVLIVIGTLLLMLPMATQSGEGASIANALFTSTTSVCVTGTVVVDTFSYWSLFGKIVILLLIQVGGLGIMSVIVLLFYNARGNLSLHGVVLLKDIYNVDNLSGVGRLLRKVFRLTFAIEFLGMLAYLPSFVPRFGAIRGAWISLFTSVSAFCNAGIDIIGPDSLMSYSGDYYIMTVTMLLIILGGIGYIVLLNIEMKIDLMNRIRHVHSKFVRMREHTKLAITVTLVLIIVGALLILVLEWDNPETIGYMSLPDKLMNSLFQSVTLRTAGFATIPQECLRDSSALVCIILMFIGGSPMGTAGGIKTVTFYLLFANINSFILGKDETVVFGRRVTGESIKKATSIAVVHLSIMLIITVWLLALTNAPVTDVMYEVASATSTVGVSRGFVLTLPDIRQLILIIAMYLGRIGPISMLFLFNSDTDNGAGVRTAEGHFIIG
ncbi:MAG: potassium transporter TrkH [Lachnospiraceae bacterium]|nr:potassium transporter TrkH [Lachnospiraceae bacterium]